MSDGVNVQIVRYRYSDLTSFQPGKLVMVNEGHVVLWCPYCEEIYVVHPAYIKDVSTLTMTIPVQHTTKRGLCEYWFTEGYTRPTQRHNVAHILV